MLYGIKWMDVHLMMVDAPFFEPPKRDGDTDFTKYKSKKPDAKQADDENEPSRRLKAYLDKFK